MRHLIIIAHPRRGSFNMKLANAYGDELSRRGHEVDLRDLYALRFDPVLSARDLAAALEGRTPRDIGREQAAIRDAQVLTLVAPMWWSSFPAIMKGYIDRVFAEGFAYSMKGGRYRPLLTGKKGVIITTTAASADELAAGGTRRAVKAIQDVGVMEFCGIEMLRHLYFSSIAPGLPKIAAERHIDQVRRFVRRNF
jgi:NAD(P)H dehydrogenase (quinone)